MDKLNLKLKMFSDSVINIDKINIYSVSIKQIAEFGYEKFSQGLSILCIKKSEIQRLIGEDISPFEFLKMNMRFDINVQKLLVQILSLIFRITVTFSERQQGFIIGVGILNSSNFDKITNIIYETNSIKNQDDIDENPSNEKARAILVKRGNTRNKLMKNSPDRSILDIPDMVSIVSTGLKLPINKVLNYSIYQLSDQFSRLMAKESYETTIESLIHGADKNNLDLKHWTEK